MAGVQEGAGANAAAPELETPTFHHLPVMTSDEEIH